MDAVSSMVTRAGSRSARLGSKTNGIAPKDIIVGASSNIWKVAILLLILAPSAVSQNQSPKTTAEKPNAVAKGIDYLFNYLNMAGTKTAANFRPMTQKERNQLYIKTLKNPLGYFKAAASAGIDQAKDKPEEWEQGASGYGKRFANILGQYTIQRTVTYGASSLLHEDNRYFNSGKQSFWPRVGYAVSAGVLARHDDGSLHFSISQVGGVAAGAFISRLWQPSSQSSAGDGTVSFAITMGSNAAFGMVKEFLPDLGRAIAKKRKKPAINSSAGISANKDPQSAN